MFKLPGMHFSTTTSKSNPFERFPLDLFTIIVRLILGIDSTQHFPSSFPKASLQQLRLVAKSWNTTIEAMPAVWTVLDCRDPPLWVIKSITRAATSNVHIRYDTISGTGRQHMEFDEFMGIVVHVLGRWQSLFVAFNEPFDLPDTLILRSAPSLKHMSIHTKGPGRYRHLSQPKMARLWDSVFGGVAPCLLSLKIHSQPIRWDCGILGSTRLQRLEIYEPFDKDMRLTSFLDILSSLPNLTHLTICDISFEAEEERINGVVSNSVALEKLVLLEWSATVTEMTKVLRALRYPDGCILAIRCRGSGSDNPEAFGDIFASLSPQLQSLAETCGGRVTVSFSADGRTNITTASKRFWLEFTSGMTLTPFTAMLQEHKSVFQAIPISLIYDFLHSFLPFHYHDYQALFDIAALLPSTSILFVAGAADQVLEALEAIYALTPRVTLPSWAFQEVQVLETPHRGVGFYEALVTHLESFHEARPAARLPALHLRSDESCSDFRRMGEVQKRYPQARWCNGSSATRDEFEDRLEMLMPDGQLAVQYPRFR